MKPTALWPDVLAALAWITAAFLILPGVYDALLWNSDALFTESLARSVLSGGSLRTFFFPPPGFFFPDLVNYLSIRHLVADFRRALWFYLVMQYIILFMCLLYFQRLTGRPAGVLVFVPVVVLLFLAYVPQTMALFWPLHHGAQAALCLCILCAVFYRERRTAFWFLLTAAVLASDPLLVTWLLLPALTILWVSPSRWLFWIAVCPVAFLLREFLQQFLFLPDPFPSFLELSFFDFKSPMQFRTLALSALLLLLSVFLFFVGRFFPPSPFSRWRQVSMAILVGQMITVCFFLWKNQTIALRYLLPLVLLAILFASEILHWLYQRHRFGAAAMVLLFLFIGLKNRPPGPDWGECLTALQGKTYRGLADSFKARPFALHTGQLVVQVDRRLKPHFWMNSHDEYYAFLRARDVPVFVVESGLEGPELDALRPARIISCAAGRFLILEAKDFSSFHREELDLWRKLTGR